jgi:hypothetical protein
MCKIGSSAGADEDDAAPELLEEAAAPAGIALIEAAERSDE